MKAMDGICGRELAIASPNYINCDAICRKQGLAGRYG